MDKCDTRIRARKESTSTISSIAAEERIKQNFDLLQSQSHNSNVFQLGQNQLHLQITNSRDVRIGDQVTIIYNNCRSKGKKCHDVCTIVID